ncbi:hypothetical protein [Rothia nasimurium]|uniref:hypothetical protein n=1 Tax=Rothia nasimurium TaxID=85336 RepID=UPI001F33A06D|nr:hypothetical protein [Rothia nasimurium]
MTQTSEEDMTGLLHRRYSGRNQAGLPRYIAASQVLMASPGKGIRRADFIALDSQTEEVWNENKDMFDRHRPPVHGFEIKVSRTDWLSEHRTAGKKSELWRSYCNYWWLVVPNPNMVKPEELPEGWGLLAGVKRLRAVIKPARVDARPLDAELVLMIARYSQRRKK